MLEKQCMFCCFSESGGGEGGGGGGTGTMSQSMVRAAASALSGKPWYYGAITRTQCDVLLNQHGHDGDFLIRDSETNVRKIAHTLYNIYFPRFSLKGKICSKSPGRRSNMTSRSS